MIISFSLNQSFDGARHEIYYQGRREFAQLPRVSQNRNLTDFLVSFKRMRLWTCWPTRPFNGSVSSSMVETNIGKKIFRYSERTNRNEYLSTFQNCTREELGRKAIKIIRSRCYWWIKYGFAANFTDECWKVTVEYRRDRIANIRVLLLAAGNLRAHPSRREFRHWCGARRRLKERWKINDV